MEVSVGRTEDGGRRLEDEEDDGGWRKEDG